MTDVVTNPADHSKFINESKFFKLCQELPMLQMLVPDLPTQMTGETEIDEVAPRTDEDGEDTRILINYTNLKGNSSLYKLNDSERLTRRFDVDHFINGFMNASLAAASEDDNPVDVADKVILLAMNMAVSGVLGIDNEMRENPRAGYLCEQVVRSVTAIMFPDAYDVLILVQETPRSKESEKEEEGLEKTDSIIMAMWGIKLRNLVTEPTPDS